MDFQISSARILDFHPLGFVRFVAFVASVPFVAFVPFTKHKKAPDDVIRGFYMVCDGELESPTSTVSR